jgi:hypothetical protein
VAIRASGNVSSITDNGTGDYTLNFTSALADGNYAITACVRGDDPLYQDSLQVKASTTPNTTSVNVINCSTRNGAATFIGRDASYVTAAIFR